MKKFISIIVDFFCVVLGINTEATYSAKTAAPNTRHQIVPLHKPIPREERTVRQISAIVAPAASSAPEPAKGNGFWKRTLDRRSACLIKRPDGKTKKAQYMTKAGELMVAKIVAIRNRRVNLRRNGQRFNRELATSS